MLGCRSGILSSIKSTLDFRLKLDQFPFQEYEDSFPISNSNDTSEDVDLLLFNKKTAKFRVANQHSLSFKAFSMPGNFHITFWCNISSKTNNMFLFAIGQDATQISVHVQTASGNIYLYLAGQYFFCNVNLAINTWYYFIITRSSGVINVYVSNVAGTTMTSRLTVNSNLFINNNNIPVSIGTGRQISGSLIFYSDANMADFVLKKEAYTGPLTLPTERI